MIPSVVASQIRRGIEEFLLTTFPITTPFFEGCLERLLAEDRAVFQGPFLSLRLPFQPGTSTHAFFPEVAPPSFRPFVHQEHAFERLGSDPPVSTLVATGTGSGKTECFLYPILDHCRRHRDVRGIKAVVVYPMNALANDQARRFARTIHASEALRGHVTAGLYIGGRDREEHAVMGADHLITSRDVIRDAPPDILLTNYKMLDYLLIRPADRPLWRFNGPETVRYLVVDELHTFDGAQGTDLACLLRRLKARLKTPKGFVCCVGTSATLGVAGGAGAEDELRHYASTIFGEVFPEGCILGEARMGPEEFLRGELVRRFQLPGPEERDLLDPLRHDTRAAWLAEQARLWLDEELREGLDRPVRQRLAHLLRGHWFLRNLLLTAGDVPRAIPEALAELARQLPGVASPSDDYLALLLQSFLALVSEARVDVEGREEPLVEVRLDVWLRELTRLVCRVEPREADAPPRLAFHDDLRPEERQRSLPLVHCRDCGMTGWGGVLAAGGERLQPSIEAFYGAYFAYAPSVCFLYPGDELLLDDERQLFGRLLCSRCLRLWSGNRGEHCPACAGPSEQTIAVAVPLSSRRTSTGLRRGHHDCAWCGGRNTLSIVGSRSASLTSVAISQLFTSTYNEDKKLLAFSDSVQDASHRAGFFGARTFTFSFRTALQQVVDEQAGPVRLVDLPRLFLERWRAKLPHGEFIATFFPPDLEWWADYETLTSTGRLPTDSDLPEQLARRLDWEIWSEYTFESRVGRTLEKTSCSAVGLGQELLQTAVERLLPRLSEEIGSLRGLAAKSLRPFLAGFVLYLKNRGGVFHPALISYLDRRGTNWELNRVGYLPPFGTSSRLPVFLSTRAGRAFDALVRASTSAGATWYEDWLVRSLGGGNAALRADAHEIYSLALDELVASGILFERPASAASRVWGLEPAIFEVTNRVGQLRCRQCSFNVSVPEPEVPAWEDAPCLRYRCPGTFKTSPGREDYYRRLYKSGDVARVFAREHTALLEGATREDVERGFLEQDRPASPNLLSCTPTLEMGVDIGDLSAVALCSMPPKPSNFIQRVGRAGRRDGNAVLLTVAAGRPHDLYFFEEPREMLLGQVAPPGCFLNAAAVLARQFFAFVFDRWVESGIAPEALPARVGPVLDAFDRGGPQNKGFPNNLLVFLTENRPALEHGFLTIFEDDVEEATRQQILDFSHGTDADTPGLETRLIDALVETAKERRSLQNAIRRLNERIRRAAADPAAAADGADETEQLQREKQALNEVVKRLNDRPLLELLTDEGLLPNYAFPEAGVQLKSILYRRIEKATPGGPRYETRTYLYQRPAEAAIAELAPTASFYAEGRRLVIDQINVDLSREEVWRFCRRCSHMDREPSVEPRRTCPACGDPLWEDEGQKRSLLRMRQVICNQDESRSRSRDESDDREVEFFERGRFVVKRDADITAAYAVDDEAFPFGFDFFRRLTLREINFGKPSADGDSLAAGGKTLNGAGFVVCHACGKVKLDDELEHALHCRYRGTAAEKQAEEKALRVFFLYREFASEGIRILLPVSVFDADLQIESFVAALDLGLRRRFRGDPGHLRGTLYDEPVEGSDVRRRYLIVYDAVPGGTGYLKELMKDEQALLDVLAEAREALAKCSCQNDPAKDGCYRCLLAYRGRHDRLRTSRRRALALLDKIQERRDKIKPVERLDRLPINGLVESELEQQFVEALRASRPGGTPVQLTPQIVHGRPGWYLQTAWRSYLIEPQVELGPEQGVAVPGRADFVIYPARETPGDLPIAVFTDGFEYHADPLAPAQRLGLDTAQRMALLRSGRFRVWSLTWDDVRPPDASVAAAFEPTGVATWQAARQVLAHLDPESAASWADLPRMTSLDLLLERLGPGADRDWSDPARAWLAGFLSTNRRFFTADTARGLRSQLLSPTGLAPWPPPGAADAPFAGGLAGSLVGDSLAANPAFRGLVFALVDALSSADVSRIAGTFRLHEDAGQSDRQDFRRTWRQFLWLLNLLQFAGPVEFVTSVGLREKTYKDLLDTDFLAAEPGVVTARSAEWDRARAYATPEVLELLGSLEAQGVPAPQVGFEWLGASGRIVATAELAWEAARVAVLVPGDEPFAPALRNEDWIVFLAATATADPEALIRTLRERSG